MDTERALQLLESFKNGIDRNPGPGLTAILEYQDIIGRSNYQDIMDFEDDLDTQEEKKHFIWVNFTALAHETALDILRKTVLRRWVEKEAEALEVQCEEAWGQQREAETKLREEEARLQGYKKAIFKRIRKIEDEKEKLSRRLSTTQQEVVKERKKNKFLTVVNQTYFKKAGDLAKIRALLAQ